MNSLHLFRLNRVIKSQIIENKIFKCRLCAYSRIQQVATECFDMFM